MAPNWFRHKRQILGGSAERSWRLTCGYRASSLRNWWTISLRLFPLFKSHSFLNRLPNDLHYPSHYSTTFTIDSLTHFLAGLRGAFTKSRVGAQTDATVVSS